jgi:hypothetical protein
MKRKVTYRIRNWKEYNRALKQRGSLTIWLSDEAIKNWTIDKLTGERGGLWPKQRCFVSKQSSATV